MDTTLIDAKLRDVEAQYDARPGRAGPAGDGGRPRRDPPPRQGARPPRARGRCVPAPGGDPRGARRGPRDARLRDRRGAPGDGPRGGRAAGGAEASLVEELKVLLLPRDPADDKNVILEIRAGAGGEEAALFAGELLRMYLRYAERHRFRAEVMSLQRDRHRRASRRPSSRSPATAPTAASSSRAGTHRVQRVPATESSGRIHTSTATVVVLPEAEEADVEIDEDRDLRIDVKRSSGPGGQSVNTTDSAVRITHLPSGPRRGDPGREEPAQEQGEGDGRPPCPPARHRARRSSARPTRRRDAR